MEPTSPYQLVVERDAPITASGPPRLHQEVRILTSEALDTVTVEIPLTTADQLFYRDEPDRVTISDDPRRLYQQGMALDPRSLYSLLQFGAIVPPLSLWAGIKRFIPGQTFRISSSELTVKTVRASPDWPAEVAETDISDEGQARRVEESLDAVMRATCPDENPVILFSGGVDSGLLAARAAAMGWRETTLYHYSFGTHDAETRLARSMAEHLGLELVCVPDDKGSLAVLERAAATYRQPFGDHSTLPTSQLAAAAVRSFPHDRVVLDGTGADGAFGLFGKADRLSQLYRLPHRLRRTAGSLYPMLGTWRRPAWPEPTLRLARRSAQMPVPAVAVAQNALHGVTYETSEDIAAETLGCFSQWMRDVLPSDEPRVQVGGLDLALVCSGIFVQKAKVIFDDAGRRVVYPFLNRLMVELALRRALRWPGAHLPKRPLALALKRSVPATMVDRPKSGFAAPLDSHLAQPQFLQAYDQVCRTGIHPSIDLDERRLRALRSSVEAGERLPEQTYNFLWALVFTHLWLQQFQSVGSTSPTL